MVRDKVKVYDEFCKSNNCKEFVEWSFGHGDCSSCKLIGQSYNVTEYPKDCFHLEEIKNYESK